MSEYHERKPLIDKIWANVEPSIDGYSKLIEMLLNHLTTQQLRDVAEIMD